MHAAMYFVKRGLPAIALGAALGIAGGSGVAMGATTTLLGSESEPSGIEEAGENATSMGDGTASLDVIRRGIEAAQGDSASVDDQDTAQETETAVGLGDGVYVVDALYAGGTVPVTIVVSEGKIASVTIDGELEGAPEADASAATQYADGVYSAEARGIGGSVPVTVTIEGGVIADVEIGDNLETQGIGTKAIELLPPLIVEANGIDGVDGISGASVTSNAIFEAVTLCLEQATL